MRRKRQKMLRAWAEFRFSVIGQLLACPPPKGKLQEALDDLAARTWSHPTLPKMVNYNFSTIERWYYQARESDDPIQALMRKTRADAGHNRAMSQMQLVELGKQYQRYPHWSYQLHLDNLVALTKERPDLGLPPKYATVRRRMIERGWRKQKSARAKPTKGMQMAAERLEQREVRSFEAEFVHQLWHLDFHKFARRVVDSAGRWQTALALAVLDDRSRLCCHLQWYLAETAENLIHALRQAFQKRGLPRSLMHDNGAPMIAHETQNGLVRLGIVSDNTLPYSPYQNGKQEVFWATLEGRLLAMLTHVDPLSLDFLNRASLAWVEQEYNRRVHEELDTSPLDRMLKGPEVGRPCPEGQALQFAFTLEERRTRAPQRRHHQDQGGAL